MRSDMAVEVIARRRRALPPGPVRCTTMTGPHVGEPNDLIRGPKWRTRTTPGRRRVGVAVTVAIIVLLGLAIVGAVTLGLRALDAPGWVVAMPWLLPIAGTVTWTLVSPTAAVLSDDDDDSWTGYAIRWVLVGPDEPRSVPTRLIAAVLLGAPIVWSFVVLTVVELSGIV